MYVSKEEAKRMIDETHGKIWIDSFNGVTYIHTKPKQITVDEGKRIISKASTVDYLDNDFFGHLCLQGVQTEIIHNINFPLVLWEWCPNYSTYNRICYIQNMKYIDTNTRSMYDYLVKGSKKQPEWRGGNHICHSDCIT